MPEAIVAVFFRAFKAAARVLKMDERKSLKDVVLTVIQKVKVGGRIKFQCVANPDKKCKYLQTNFNSGNFKRHLQGQHAAVAKGLGLNEEKSTGEPEQVSEEVPEEVPEEVLTEEEPREVPPEENPREEPPAKKPRRVSSGSKLLVDTNKKKVILGTLQLVASHSMPKRFPDWEGAKTLLLPLYQAAGIPFTRAYVTSLVVDGANRMKELISERVKGKIINLKIDSASRRGRHVFAINAQFMNGHEDVEIIHLGKYLK